MARRNNIFLVGPMGAGKSTIGRELAKQLKLEFLDSDQEIEKRTGVDIPFIFEIEGEEGFRKREKQIIDELTQVQGIVLATGGGAVLDPDNRARLVSRGFVIYLHAPIEQLLERTFLDRKRPLLQNEDPRQKMEHLIEKRDPLYRDVADLIVETGRRTVRRVVNEICQHRAIQ
ncbi:MAG: shikimate kinase AroK [Gammaproteobacteria bacterium]|nr:shikimate kinase AroK [Gammaproteobacteria bacterium]MCI0591297.1 shikimate kinase AroK [Gammaproteobacteria bacterium]